MIPLTTRIRARLAGFSLLELVISSTLLALMALTVAGLAGTGTDTSDYAGRLNHITEIAQDELAAVRRDTIAAVRLFTDDASGTQYLGRLERGSYPGLNGARLPGLESQGTFRRDTPGDERSGNVLFFAQHDRTYQWTHPVQTTVTYRIDLYRFMAYYLRRVRAGSLSAADNGLDLCRWVSVPFADAQQVEDITDTDHRKLLLESLFAGENQANPSRPYPVCRYLWRFGADLSVSLSMQRIVAGGTLADLTGPGQPLFEVPADRDGIRALRLWRRGVTVATNAARPNLGVGRFALVDNNNDGFPHGFEVQIIGPAAARQVLIHLSLLGTQLRGHKAYIECSVVADCRDL